MALLPTIPQNVNLTLIQGAEQDFTFIARNPDGTVFDATGFDAATMTVMTDALSQTVMVSPALTGGTAGPTGISMPITEQNVLDIIAVAGPLRVTYKLVATDATDTINLAYGNLQCTLNGS